MIWLSVDVKFTILKIKIVDYKIFHTCIYIYLKSFKYRKKIILFFSYLPKISSYNITKKIELLPSI